MSSSSSSTDEDEKKGKTEHFHLISHEDVNKYDLPEDRTSYVNEHIRKFISGKELNDSFLTTHPGAT